LTRLIFAVFEAATAQSGSRLNTAGSFL